MKNTKNYNIASEPFSTKNCFARIADKRLSRKEKRILEFIHNNKQELRTTQTVNCIVSEIECSESSVWSSIKSLRSFGLIITERGALGLSKPAKAIVKDLTCQKCSLHTLWALAH